MAMSPLIRLLPVREDSQIELFPRTPLKQNWKSGLFSFGSTKNARRWGRNSEQPVRRPSEAEDTLNDAEARAIHNLSKWKHDRLHARLAASIGSFIRRETDPGEAFLASNFERLARRPDSE